MTFVAFYHSCRLRSTFVFLYCNSDGGLPLKVSTSGRDTPKESQHFSRQLPRSRVGSPAEEDFWRATYASVTSS